MKRLPSDGRGDVLSRVDRTRLGVPHCRQTLALARGHRADLHPTELANALGIAAGDLLAGL